MKRFYAVVSASLLGFSVTASAMAQTATPPPSAMLVQGFPTSDAGPALNDELLYQEAAQAYLWASPLLNIWAMKEGSEKTFGAGYNVLPIWKERLNAKTLVTTPNSDVIYAMGYLDLKNTGPTVIIVPPHLQGILDDFFQRGICSVGTINGKHWCGDVGLAGPDKGNGGKYLILPPDYKGSTPSGYLTFRSRTYGVFVFWRGFFQDPNQLTAPVKLMERTRIFPLGHESAAKRMQFPDASGVPVNMLPPHDYSAWEMLSRAIDSEYVDPADLDMRGLLATVGIIKGQPFKPDSHTREILDQAALRAWQFEHYVFAVVAPQAPGGTYYSDRHYINVFSPSMTPQFQSPVSEPTYTNIVARSSYFGVAYATSPAMTINLPDEGSKYPTALRDASGTYLSGDNSYRMHLPPKIPVKLFWSVTVYDSVTASGLDNGQKFPSINQMDNPAMNADGSIDIYFGPKSPGPGKNWLATVAGKGFFVILRLYGPGKAFYDQTWKPGDLEKLE